jgi:hypothetical protein
MCGRVIQSSGPLRYATLEGMDVRDSRIHNYPPRWNSAPSQDLLVIRRNPSGRKPINAKCETVRTLPTFRDAYARRRCIVPVYGFFAWQAIKGQKAKQPYAIAMKDGSPFGLGGPRRADADVADLDTGHSRVIPNCSEDPILGPSIRRPLCSLTSRVLVRLLHTQESAQSILRHSTTRRDDRRELAVCPFQPFHARHVVEIRSGKKRSSLPART